MADGTKIEWTDSTWNPILGCMVKSAGCKHCYAMKLAGTRMKNHRSRIGLTDPSKAGPVWNGEVRFMPDWLLEPLSWKKPRRIFVVAHGDLFYAGVPDEWIDQVFAVMALCPQHTFQVLTKRPDRMREYLAARNGMGNEQICRAINKIPNKLGNRHGALSMPLPNVWLGTSIEDQATANERIPLLLDTPAAVRWISAEPLLGPVNLETIDINSYEEVAPLGLKWLDRLEPGMAECTRLDWVVCGGESGPGARPMHPEWARSLRDQCQAAGVPFLFKQWGDWLPQDQVMTMDLARASFHFSVNRTKLDDAKLAANVGKKAAGRVLDGRTWDEYPGERP